MKKILAMILALTMLFSLAACASNEAAPTDAPVTENTAAVNNETEAVAAHSEEVTLTFWAFSKWAGVTGQEADGQTGDWEKAMAEKFHEMHPNVTINVEVFDFSSGPEKAAAAIAAGETPDVIHDAETRMMKYSNAGYLVSVYDYMSEADLATYNDGAIDSVSLADGNAYWLPFGAAPMGLMVNKTLFEQAGCADLLPQGDDRTWTIDEFYTAITTALENLDNVYGVPLFADTTDGETFSFIWTFAHGGRIVDSSTNTMACNTDEAQAGLTFWKQMIDEGIATPGGASLKASEVWSLFNTQQVLCAPAAAVNYSRAVKAQADGTADMFEIMLYAMPHAEGEDTVAVAFPHGFGVWQNEDPEALYWSQEFVKFLASDENATAISAAAEFSYKKCAQNMYDGNEDSNIQFASQLMNYLIPNGSTVPGYTSLRNEIMPYYQQLYLGEISVEEFCAQVEEMGNEFLANYES